MEKEFVPYESALRLKEIGFKERVLTYYENKVLKVYDKTILGWDFNTSFLLVISAPTFSQAFRWVRKEQGFYVIIQPSINNDFSCIIWNSKAQNHIGVFKTYEEAEIACLDKLIGIVQKNITTKALN